MEAVKEDMHAANMTEEDAEDKERLRQMIRCDPSWEQPKEEDGVAMG